MKAKKRPMTTFEKIFYAASFLFLIGAFIFLGTRDYQIREEPDNILIAKEFKTLTEANHFKYITGTDIVKDWNKKDMIVLMGFKENIWTEKYMVILNDVATELNIGTIYYYDFKENRQKNNKEYEIIAKHLKGYNRITDSGREEIYAPSLLVLKQGEIIGFDDELAFMKETDVDAYWSDYKINLKKNELKELLKKFKE